MIPKIIHYCWFGKNPLSELAKKCIASWKKYCPDYEIIEWNEDNFDINCNIYVKEAYESRKWAFVTDYVRLYALDKCGGIYMDTDVELLKGIDEFLVHNSFSGFETEKEIPTAIMGSVKDGQWIKYLLSYYDERHFIKPDGTLDTTTNVRTITDMTVKKYDVKLNNEYQNINDELILYPNDYFCPKDYHTGNINLTDNTVCIHHFNASWHSEEEKTYHERYIKYLKKYGEEKARKKIRKTSLLLMARRALKNNGIIGFSKKLIYKLLSFLIRKKAPLDNVLFFETEGDFSDNGRTLYEYLIENGYNTKYKIVWSVKKKENFVSKKNKNVHFVSKENTLNNLIHTYYLNRAKFLIFTHPYWLKKKKEGQFVINLWHGIPIKGQGTDLSNIYDYAIVTSESTKPLFNKFIGAREQQMVVLGNPRNDLLFKNKDISMFIKKYAGCETYSKIILSMPTFRQGSAGKYEKFENKYSINTISNRDELVELNEYLKKNNVLLIAKVHHLQNLDFLDCTHLSNIIYLTDDDLFENDIQLYEILANADCLLTDFSSVYFDYLLLNRPIGFFVTDLHEYSRGFLVENPLEYMPGDKIYSNDDLYRFLDNLINNIDTHQDDRKKILDFAYKMQDGNCCKRVTEFILNL